MEKLIDRLFDSKNGNYTFFNFPQKKDISDYEEAKYEFVNYYKTIKGVISICQFGKVSALGLSDLDFIVVLDDEYKHQYGTRYDRNFFPLKTQYILTHSQLFVSKQIMKNIYSLFDLSNLEKIWGEDILVEQYLPEEAITFKMLREIDLYISRFPKLFLKALLDKKINVRNIIARLNAIKHSFVRLKNITGSQSENFVTYIKELEQLRSLWFNNNENENLSILKLLLKKAININYFLINDLNKYLNSNIQYDVLRKNFIAHKVGFKSNGMITYFEKEWEPTSSLERTYNIFRETKKYVQFLPLNFSFHLFEYIKTKNKFANFVEQQLFLKPNNYLNGNFVLAQKKAEYTNRYFEFLENKMIDGAITLNNFFGYKPNIKRFIGEYRYSNYKRILCGKFRKIKLFQ